MSVPKTLRRLVVGLIVALAITPAVVRALRGVVEQQMFFQDCVQNGMMESDFADGGTPNLVTSHYDEFPTSHSYIGHLHGNHGFFEAESYAHTTGYAALVVGTMDGNVSPGTGVAEMDSASDVSTMTLTNICHDCAYGRFNVHLKQKIWQRVRMGWTPGHDLDPLGHPQNYYGNHKSWGCARVESIPIDYDMIVTAISIPYSTTGSNTITPSASSGGKYGTDIQWPVVVEVNGGAASQQPAGWATTYQWGAPFSLRLTYLFETDVTSSTFICGYSGGSESYTVWCHHAWDITIDDPAPQGVLETRRSSMAFELEYATCIYISSIEVTTNCDGWEQNCPCLKREQSFGSPSTP